MLILSIDPSEANTGLVLVSEGAVVESCTMPVQKAVAWLKRIEKPEIVLLERPALGPGANLSTVAAWKILSWTTETLFSGVKITHISPGQWKPYAKKLPVPDALKTRHEKDAYLMLCYWRALRGKSYGRP